MKVRILYAKGWNNKTKKYYNIYIYAKISINKRTGNKISKKEYEKNKFN